MTLLAPHVCLADDDDGPEEKKEKEPEMVDDPFKKRRAKRGTRRMLLSCTIKEVCISPPAGRRGEKRDDPMK